MTRWLRILLALGLVVTFFFSQTKLELGPLVIYPPEILIYLWALVVLLGRDSRERLRQTILSLPKEIKLAAALILTGSLIATVLPEFNRQSLGALKSWIITPMLLGLLIAQARLRSRELYLYLALIGVGLVAVGLIGFEPNNPLARIQGIYQSPNIYAALTAPLATFFYVLWRTREQPRLVLLVLTIALLSAVALSRSIGAIFGAGVMIGFYELTRQRRLSWPMAVLAAGFVLLCVGLIAQRLSLDNNSLESRFQIWQTGLEIVRIYPVTGAGLRGFETLYPQIVGSQFSVPIEWAAPQAHNLLLSFWTNTGLLGLLGFSLLFYQVARLQKPGPAYLALGVIFFHGLVDAPYWRLDLAMLFWVYLASFYGKRAGNEQ